MVAGGPESRIEKYPGHARRQLVCRKLLTIQTNCLNYLNLKLAGIAQLVEYKLPKLGVASSNLVARSILSSPFLFQFVV
jgi:hypothetical protein